MYSPFGVTIDNCLFLLNEASGNGGAIYDFLNNTLTVRNSTFIQNSAANGGAIYS